MKCSYYLSLAVISILFAACGPSTPKVRYTPLPTYTGACVITLPVGTLDQWKAGGGASITGNAIPGASFGGEYSHTGGTRTYKAKNCSDPGTYQPVEQMSAGGSDSSAKPSTSPPAAAKTSATQKPSKATVKKRESAEEKKLKKVAENARNVTSETIQLGALAKAKNDPALLAATGDQILQSVAYYRALAQYMDPQVLRKGETPYDKALNEYEALGKKLKSEFGGTRTIAEVVQKPESLQQIPVSGYIIAPNPESLNAAATSLILSAKQKIQ
jgi:hypothetical protein